MKGNSTEDENDKQMNPDESVIPAQSDDNGVPAGEGNGGGGEELKKGKREAPKAKAGDRPVDDSPPPADENGEPPDHSDDGASDGNGADGGDDDDDDDKRKEEPGSSGRRALIAVSVIFVVIFLLFILAYIFNVGSIGGRGYPPTEFYVQDQIIVSGPSAGVEAAIGSLPVGITVVETGTLRFNQILGRMECPGLSVGSQVGQDLVIALYEITSGTDVKDIIEELEKTGGVTAEPNWLSGTPWEVEGSPWEVEGSPWEVEGSGQRVKAPLTTGEAFNAQWAWGERGVQVNAMISMTHPPTGTGVQVAVFDTAPFEDQDEVDRLLAEVQTLQKMNLSLHVPEKFTTLTESEHDPKLDLSSHGLFAAGLVYKVAPGSEIELIRVLQDDNRGDLFLLNQEIFNYIVRSSAEQPVGRVINASLVIRIPPEEASDLASLPTEIQSLQDILTAARCLDIVTVAAAGNNSANVTPPYLAGLPAGWSSVIGVAASNPAEERACFSNQGDVAAPGGDGRDMGKTRARCEPRTHKCSGPDCPYAVIGPILNQPEDEPEEIAFTYWSGSSFAAPIVSGLAALVLDQADGNLRPAEVRAIIECAASKTLDRHLGEGTVDVEDTIARCMGSVQE